MFGILFALKASPRAQTWENSVHHFHPNNLHSSSWECNGNSSDSPKQLSRKRCNKKRIKMILVNSKKKKLRRARSRRMRKNGATPMAIREYASSSYRYLAFLRPERRGEEEISHSLPLPFVIFRRFHAGGQLRSPGPLDGCSTL